MTSLGIMRKAGHRTTDQPTLEKSMYKKERCSSKGDKEWTDGRTNRGSSNSDKVRRRGLRDSEVVIVVIIVHGIKCS